MKVKEDKEIKYVLFLFIKPIFSIEHFQKSKNSLIKKDKDIIWPFYF